MKAIFDSSVMIAAFLGDHANHDVSLRIFAEATPPAAACGSHSLAEVYAAMTALPVRPLLAPEQVFLFIQQISERMTIVCLQSRSVSPAVFVPFERGVLKRGLQISRSRCSMASRRRSCSSGGRPAAAGSGSARPATSG